MTGAIPPKMTVQYDRQLRIVFADEAALRYAGKSLQEVRGKRCLALWHSELTEFCQNCPVHRILASQDLTHLTRDCVVNLSGKNVYYRITTTLLHNDQGEPNGVLAHYVPNQDHAEIRKPQEMIAEQQFQQSSAPQLIAEYYSGSILMINNAMQAMLNITAEKKTTFNLADWRNFFQQPIDGFFSDIETFGVSDHYQISQSVRGVTKRFNLHGQRLMIEQMTLLHILLEDVTEIHAIQSLLQRMRQRLTTAMTSAGVNVWEYHIPHQQFSILNPHPEKNQETVYTLDFTKPLPDEVFALHPDDKQPFVDAISNLGENTQTLNWQFRVKNSYSNTYDLYQLHGDVVQYSEDGSALLAEGTIQDITPYIKIKQEQDRFENIYSQVFLHSPAILVITRHASGEIIDINQAFEAMTGYQKEEVVGRRLAELAIWCDETQWPPLSDMFDQQGFIDEMITSIHDRLDRQHHVLFSTTKIDWQGEACSLTIALDITEQFKLIESLQTSQKEFQATFDTINDGIFEWNIATGETLGNGKLLTMLGYPSSKIPLSIEKWLQHIVPEHRQDILSRMQNIREGRRDSGETLIPMYTASGGLLWLQHKFQVVEKTQEGKPLRVIGIATDMTSRVLMEQELQQQKETLEATFDAINEGIWELDFKQREAFFSERCNEIFQIGKTELSFESMDYYVTHNTHPDDLARFSRQFRDHLRGKTPFFFSEVRYAHNHDAWHWLQLRGQVIERNELGKPIRMLGSVTDINDRKQLEKEIALIREGVNKASIMTFLIRLDSTFAYVNEQCSKELGYSEDELLQMGVPQVDADFLDPNNDAEKLWQYYWNRVLTEQSFELEITFQPKDKPPFPALLSVQQVKLDGEYFVWAFGKNVAELKQIESELASERASLVDRIAERTAELETINEFLDVIIQTLPIPVYFKDHELRYLDANQAFGDFFGFAREEVIGRTVYDLVGKELADKITRDDHELLAHGGNINIPYYLTNKDNELRNTQLIKTVFTDQKTGKRGIVGTFIDNTDQEMLRTQLEQTNVELQQALKVKDEFLANITHELRTPLTSIIGYSELMLTGMGGKITASQEKYLNNVHAAGEHLLSIINDILDISKFNAGITALNKEEVRVRSLCVSALSIMEPRAFKKDIQIEFEFDDTITNLYCDAQRLRQVLINLMTNAIKFSDNYARIGLRVEQRQEPAPHLTFQVWDHGIGIKPEDQEKIFEPFTQAAGSLDRNYDGSGIGLALVKKFVELHDGTIHLHSQPGEGSTFTVTIPL